MSGHLKEVRKLTVWTSERTFWAEGAASAQALGNIQEENMVKMESGGVEEEFREGTEGQTPEVQDGHSESSIFCWRERVFGGFDDGNDTI